MSDAWVAETFTATNLRRAPGMSGRSGLAAPASAAHAEERNEPGRCEQHGNDLPHQMPGSMLAVTVIQISAAAAAS